MTKNPKPPSKKKPFNKYIKYSALGTQMLATILIGTGIGYLLDKRYTPEGEIPIFTTVFSLVFVCIAIFVAVRELIKES